MNLELLIIIFSIILVNYLLLSSTGTLLKMVFGD
jgi:hypothetical protein